MAKYRHDVGEESPSLRHMEPEHLGLPPRGAFPSRSGNRAALRLHLSQLGFGRDRPGAARRYVCDTEPSGVRERLAVVVRLPSRARPERSFTNGQAAALRRPAPSH
jgi:hypothetical protein